jgi:hypothetical protein
MQQRGSHWTDFREIGSWGLVRNWVLGTCTKTCLESLNLVTIGQTHSVLYMKTWACSYCWQRRQIFCYSTTVQRKRLLLFQGKNGCANAPMIMLYLHCLSLSLAHAFPNTVGYNVLRLWDSHVGELCTTETYTLQLLFYKCLRSPCTLLPFCQDIASTHLILPTFFSSILILFFRFLAK